MSGNAVSEKMNKRYRSYEKSLVPQLDRNNVNLNIGVTNACNLDCIFCFSSMMPQKRKKVDSQLIRRLLREGAELGITEFNPYGNYGDPFLCSEIFEYVRYAKQLGYTYVFTNTNGLLLDENRARMAVESGFDSIKISINAGTPDTLYAYFCNV